MFYQKMAELVMGLAKGTETGQITWESTNRINQFQTSFPNNSIRVHSEDRYDVDDGNYDTIVVSIYSGKGQPMESVTIEDLAEVFPDANEKMYELFNSARRQALGVEKAVDDLISTLNIGL